MVLLEDVDDDPLDGEDGCTFLLGLMQKDGRRNKRLDHNLETIGFAIYKVTFHYKSNLDICLTYVLLAKFFLKYCPFPVCRFQKRYVCVHTRSP